MLIGVVYGDDKACALVSVFGDHSLVELRVQVHAFYY